MEREQKHLEMYAKAAIFTKFSLAEKRDRESLKRYIEIYCLLKKMKNFTEFLMTFLVHLVKLVGWLVFWHVELFNAKVIFFFCNQLCLHVIHNK